MPIKINIDAGHGSNTAGKRTPPMPKDIKINNKLTIKKGEQFREHYANVGVCYYLEQELQRCGFKTMRTGWDDNNAFDDPEGTPEEPADETTDEPEETPEDEPTEEAEEPEDNTDSEPAEP